MFRTILLEVVTQMRRTSESVGGGKCFLFDRGLVIVLNVRRVLCNRPIGFVIKSNRAVSINLFQFLLFGICVLFIICKYVYILYCMYAMVCILSSYMRCTIFGDFNSNFTLSILIKLQALWLQTEWKGKSIGTNKLSLGILQNPSRKNFIITCNEIFVGHCSEAGVLNLFWFVAPFNCCTSPPPLSYCAEQMFYFIRACRIPGFIYIYYTVRFS